MMYFLFSCLKFMIIYHERKSPKKKKVVPDVKKINKIDISWQCHTITKVVIALS